MIRVLFLLALMIGTAQAVEPSEMMADPALETRARDVSQSLRCVVCQNETIDESNAELAHDMRVLVRRRIAAGDTNQEVLHYMVQRYGDFVLLKPRFVLTTLLLWLGPLVILVLGGVAIARLMRRARPAAVPLTTDEADALAKLDRGLMIWILCGLVTLLVVAALLWPLLRGAAPAADRAAYDATVFRDQLKELERDLERGVITATEAGAARLEIQRRLLAAGKAAPTPVRADAPGQRAALTAAIAVLVPFAALGIYLTVGAPQLVGQKSASQPAPAAQQVAGHPDDEMTKLVEKLAARVRETPDNPQGWSLLARTYRQMQRFPEAADAYKHLMALTPGDADAFAGFAEAITAAAGGNVTPDAHNAFMHALEIDRTEPRARFYLGLELAQQGNAQGAIAVWRELTASATEGAPWVDAVREQMAGVAQEAGIMPMSVTPLHALEAFGGKAPQVAAAPRRASETAPASTDPASPNMSALKGKFSPENLEMIKGMVGGLAARLQSNPDDYDGWMRLGRAYTVLENLNGAKEAYAHAAKLKPTELAPKLQLADVLARGTDFDKALSPELVKVAADIHALDAKEPDALFILGLDKANSGDAKTARAMWQAALDVLPAETPLRAEITRRMAALR